jgi:osmotically-inducible protein OsmY
MMLRTCSGLMLIVLTCGCNNQDADRLGQVARTIGSKFDTLTEHAQGKVASGIQAARASWSETSLDTRVATRLRWDRQTAEAPIEVDSPGPGIVRLRGPETDLAQRRRAVDLAQSTVGVEKVVEEWESTVTPER